MDLFTLWLLGAVGIAITLAAYAILLYQIVWGPKQPSAIAWFGFGLCTFVGWVVQLYAGVTWLDSTVMSITALSCGVVACVSFSKARKRPTLTDWAAFALGLVTFVAWLLCRITRYDETLAVVLATTSDLILYWPLVRSGWLHPERDSRMAYGLNSAKFIPQLLTIAPWTLASVLYPVALVIANGGMNLYLVVRKIKLAVRKGDYETLLRTIDVEFPLASGVAVAAAYGLTLYLGPDATPPDTSLLAPGLGGFLQMFNQHQMHQVGCWTIAYVVCLFPSLVLGEFISENARRMKEGGAGWGEDVDQLMLVGSYVVTIVALGESVAVAGSMLLADYLQPGYIASYQGWWWFATTPIMAGMGMWVLLPWRIEGPLLRLFAQKMLSPFAVLVGFSVSSSWGVFVGCTAMFSILFAQLVWTTHTSYRLRACVIGPPSWERERAYQQVAAS